MSSKYVKNVREATSSKNPKVHPSSNSPLAEIQRVKMSGASDNTVASITVPPPDPPPIRTTDIEAKMFDKDHYDPTKPWAKYSIGYPGFSAFVSAKPGKFTTIFRYFERLSDRNLLYLENKLFEGRWSYFFHKQTADGLPEFTSHPRVAVTVTILSIPIAMVLIGAILGLYWVKDPNATLGMLNGLALVSAGTLALFTKARRQDVFAAKAAYAVVVVVFLCGSFTTASETSTNSGLGPTTLFTFTTTMLETATVTALSTIVETVTAQGLNTAPTGSLVASQTSSIPLSTAPASKTSGGLSQNQKIGLGVGLGVGIPAVLVALVLFLNRQKLKRKPPLRVEPIHQGLY